MAPLIVYFTLKSGGNIRLNLQPLVDYLDSVSATDPDKAVMDAAETMAVVFDGMAKTNERLAEISQECIFLLIQHARVA